MFSTKSNRGKWIWAFVDLLVVIIGVYIAFLIQSSAAERQDTKEKTKVLMALKYELETFRIQFPQFADYMTNYHEEVKDNEMTNFSGWRYNEPQYAYQIIEYAMNLENEDVIDFQLYDQLQKLYVEIKQLEHVERLITEISGKYKKYIPELSMTHELNLERKADNASQFERFLMFVRSRAFSLNRVAASTKDALLLINEQLGSEKVKEIEREIITNYLRFVSSKEEMIQMGTKYFQSFTEKEILDLYEAGKKEEINND